MGQFNGEEDDDSMEDGPPDGRPSDKRSSEEGAEGAERMSELEVMRQAVDEAHAKEKEVFEQLLRLNAEFQNFRKKSEQRISEARRSGREDVLLEIITLTDALSQAEASSTHTKDIESLKKGLSMLKSQFEKFLSEQGLVAIKSIGEKLDPHRHDVISIVQKPDAEEGTIVDEIQRGYTLFDRVVRPSRVSVAAGPKEVAQVNEEEQHG